jgi:CelD/BcsL family acetyltransferase involved in cellulose biosynthesis
MDEIRALCREYNVMLIEDCALSFMSSYKGVPLGTSGDYSVFCLYKTLPLPNGGVLVENRPSANRLSGFDLVSANTVSVAARSFTLMIQWLRMHNETFGKALFSLKRRTAKAMNAANVNRVPVGNTGFDVDSANIAMSPLSKKLIPRFQYDEIKRVRQRNFRFLWDRLCGDVPLLPKAITEDVCPLFFPLLVRDKAAAAEKLWERGVEPETARAGSSDSSGRVARAFGLHGETRQGFETLSSTRGMIQKIETLDELVALREEWDALVDASASPSIFHTHEWLCTWWKHLAENRQLFVLIRRTNGKLSAILPLALRPPQLSRMMPSTLEFLGSGVIGSDYLDVIARAGVESQALDEFAGYLADCGYMFQLSQLRRGHCLAEELAERLRHRNWLTSDERINVCPYIAMAGETWETYLAGLGSSHRYNFQRRLKNLAKLPGFQLQKPGSAREALRALNVLMDLHVQRWQSRQESSEAFQTGPIRDFHREFVQLAAERGWLRILVMQVGDTPAAALYGLRYGDVFSFYQSGFNPDFMKQSVGLVMMGLAIRSAFEEGCMEYDFLHGSEEYKYHWTRTDRELGRLELVPTAARARIGAQAYGLNRAARQLVKRVLNVG